MQVIYHTTADEKEEQKTGYQTPKNIRQVGNPAVKRKIYIEDYVVTYLAKLAMPSNTYSRGAILLGTVKKTEEGSVVFISGALESQNFELDLEETIFTNENWADIYNEIRTFFPKLSIVGWFVSRLGFSTELNGKIIQTHNAYFAGENKVLYMIDALEHEETFYLYESNGLRKQKGYYIYYEKNEAMQAYMITKGSEDRKTTSEQVTVVQRDQAILSSYRTLLQKKNVHKNIQNKTRKLPRNVIHKKQDSGFYYVASTCLTVAILAVGITVINNYDKMVLLESVIKQMSGESQEVVSQIETSEEEVSTQQKVMEQEESTEKKEEVHTGTKEPEKAGQAELIQKEEKKEQTKEQTIQKQKVETYYIVKEGDTMISISKKMFQSPKYVNTILKLNGMEEETPIYPGQKIAIPLLNE